MNFADRIFRLSSLNQWFKCILFIWQRFLRRVVPFLTITARLLIANALLQLLCCFSQPFFFICRKRCHELDLSPPAERGEELFAQFGAKDRLSSPSNRHRGGKWLRKDHNNRMPKVCDHRFPASRRTKRPEFCPRYKTCKLIRGEGKGIAKV